MNAIVERGMFNPTSLAVLRGKDAVNDVRDLLDKLSCVDDNISRVTPNVSHSVGPGSITSDELLDVFNRRRDAILTKLENKGIRIAPDPTPAFSEELA